MALNWYIAEAGFELCALLHTVPTRSRVCGLGGFCAVITSWFVSCAA